MCNLIIREASDDGGVSAGAFPVDSRFTPASDGPGPSPEGERRRQRRQVHPLSQHHRSRRRCSRHRYAQRGALRDSTRSRGRDRRNRWLGAGRRSRWFERPDRAPATLEAGRRVTAALNQRPRRSQPLRMVDQRAAARTRLQLGARRSPLTYRRRHSFRCGGFRWRHQVRRSHADRFPAPRQASG